MAYSPTTWIEGVTTLGPTNMNKIETELARLKANADIDPAAAIAYSKLNLAGGIVNADVNAAAAIAASKITGPSFSTWTPSLVQGVGVSFTTSYARTWQFGKLLVVTATLLPTSAGSLGSAITIGGLPAGANGPLGTFLYLDQGTAFYQGMITPVSTTSFTAQAHNLGSPIGTSPSFAVANTDQIWFQATYEAA